MEPTRPVRVRRKRAPYYEGGRGGVLKSGVPSVPATVGAGFRTTIWPHLGSCRRKLRSFRSRIGPAVGGGRKEEGTMRASDIRDEGRLERLFLRCGPDGAGIEDGGGNVKGEVLGRPGRYV